MNEDPNEQLNEQSDNKVAEQMPNSNKAPIVKENPVSVFVDYIEVLVVAICAVLMVFTAAFRTCTVEGASMNKTLIDAEVLLVSDLLYTPERGDIIVFHHNDGTLEEQNNKALVKRVVGVGGDTVTINHNTNEVTVTDKNGETVALDEDYVFLDNRRPNPFSGIEEYVVPEGKLFVMGDNRKASLDSRYSEIGFVDERSVLGKVYFRILPIPRIGFVK